MYTVNFEHKLDYNTVEKQLKTMFNCIAKEYEKRLSNYDITKMYDPADKDEQKITFQLRGFCGYNFAIFFLSQKGIMFSVKAESTSAKRLIPEIVNILESQLPLYVK